MRKIRGWVITIICIALVVEVYLWLFGERLSLLSLTRIVIGGGVFFAMPFLMSAMPFVAARVIGKINYGCGMHIIFVVLANFLSGALCLIILLTLASHEPIVHGLLLSRYPEWDGTWYGAMKTEIPLYAYGSSIMFTLPFTILGSGLAMPDATDVSTES